MFFIQDDSFTLRPEVKGEEATILQSYRVHIFCFHTAKKCLSSWGREGLNGVNHTSNKSLSIRMCHCVACRLRTIFMMRCHNCSSLYDESQYIVWHIVYACVCRLCIGLKLSYTDNTERWREREKPESVLFCLRSYFDSLPSSFPLILLIRHVVCRGTMCDVYNERWSIAYQRIINYKTKVLLLIEILTMLTQFFSKIHNYNPSLRHILPYL